MTTDQPQGGSRARPGAFARRLPGRRALARAGLVLLAVLVPAAAWGVTTASAVAGLGPHLARYEVTLDHLVTVDLGPLGTLVVDSPMPLTLGARVVVQEIPREVTVVDEASTLSALGADLEGYQQLLGAPQATVAAALDALAADAARRTALAALGIAAACAAGRALLGPRRRSELLAAVRPHRAAIAAGLLGVLVVGSLTSSGPALRAADDAQQASAVFDGTPLEGARLTGRLAGVIDTYGGYLVEAYRTNEQFYDDAVVALGHAWTDEVGDEEPAGQDVLTALVVSDLHCNVGMARVVNELATLAGARLVLNAGDTTVNGTAVEQTCVTAFLDAVPPGATMVVADGNHDSAQTSAQEARAGAVVLDGSVVEVEGLRILGDSDPAATRIGEGTRLVGEESLAQTAERLAEVACADGDVDLLLVHTPTVGGLTLDAGCAPAQVSGHLHRRAGPERVGLGVRYISSSTAGAQLDAPTVGPLVGVAELTLLRFDLDTGAVLDHRLVQVRPDGTVGVGSAVDWPRSPSLPRQAGGSPAR